MSSVSYFWDNLSAHVNDFIILTIDPDFLEAVLKKMIFWHKLDLSLFSMCDYGESVLFS